MSEEALDSGVSESTGSSSPEQASPAPAPSESQAQDAPAAAPTKEQEQYVPYNRFQEVIAERNAEKQRIEQMSRDMQQLQAQLTQYSKQNQPAKAENPLLARLKSIDPEFGGDYEQLVGLKDQVKEFNEWRQEQARQQYVAQANNSFNELCAQNKIEGRDKDIYRALVRDLADSRGAKDVAELANLFKEVHEGQSKYQEEYKRKVTASYVQDKTKDKVPASQTGGTPSGGKPKGPMSREQQIQLMAETLRRNKKVI